VARTPEPPGAVHLILGEDSYLAEEALEGILSAAIGPDRADALRVFQGDETKWHVVLGAARTGSLFSAQRAVVVRRADQFVEDRRAEEEPEAPPRDEKGRKGAGAKPKEHPLLAYLEDPVPDCTLVLLAAKADKRRNPWKRLTGAAQLHQADPKRGPALRAHVEQELRKRRLAVEPDALKDLLDEVGQDLRRVLSEVDKLEAWLGGEARTATADDVHAVLGRGLGRPLFLLSDAVTAHDMAVSMERLEELLDGGEEPLRILATLHRTLRQVRAAGAMQEARMPRQRIAEALLPPNMQWKIDGLLEAARRRWREPQVRLALRALDEADRRIKSGADAGTELTAALARACGRDGGAATSPRAR
jgi:DNA polymerase-3 subunit delta